MYRDFIYLDTDRVQSIIAQLQEGLLDQVVEGKTEEVSANVRLTANLLSLLIPISPSAGAGYKNTSDLRENKVLHDYAFNVALDSLREQGYLRENDFSSLPDTGFILVTGTVKIFDYDTISNIAKYWDKLDEAFKPPKTDTARKAKKKSDPYRAIRNLEVIISAFFKDMIRVRVTSSEGSIFIGPLSREHLREDRRNLIYKHGSQPKGDWFMLAEISRRPLKTESPGDRLKQLMGSGQSPQEPQNSPPSEMINYLVDRFDAFQELIGSASILDVHVSPIAIYREVHPYDVTQRED